MNAAPADAGLLPWLTGPWSRIAAVLEAGRLPHALLLHGPAGIGKRRLAARLAGAILCAGPHPRSRPCGTCRACRLLDAGSHPDFLRIEPEEGAANVSIEAVRGLVRQSTLSAGGARVAIVAPAEAMTQAAANAFLKTLEEPPGNTVFVLVSDAPGRLPATIRSRCRKAAIPPPPRSEALAWLEAGTEPERAARLLELAGGMPLAALELGCAHDDESLAGLLADTGALLAGRAEPLEVAERWRGVGDGGLVVSALFAALGGAVRRGTADPDRLYAAVDDAVETWRQWKEVPGLAEQLVYEGLALRCAGAAA